MFARKKELELISNTAKALENTQKSNELMLSALGKVLAPEEKNNDDDKVIITPEEKRLAAYALNLCTVSVSQIIDYNDENILEQEYETILNNLNLENMPKDDALLNILKQILDTVTFFRIQEGDKMFIEKEYQHKMKNAIWAGVPNFGLIVAGGNPFTVAVSLASQVGIGYMNYRKAKAENQLEKEQKEWQLQRAAIEQLNGLRRELFDASWRLAERFEFKDENRLTEKQISQYNKILMDADDIRRYERLNAISDYFDAYPSFWYHFGHAANSIAQNALLEGENEIYERYRNFAMGHFDQYMESNNYSLLREDPITSSCALEYIDLLDADKDREKIVNLLDKAINMSGRECDILQICAIAYLRISETEKAVDLLKYLVNESYNTVTNAQLLSSIYVSYLIDKNDSRFNVDYKMLVKKVPEELLFPMPEEGEDIEELKSEFIKKQQAVLYKQYGYTIKNYYELCSIKFNKALLGPFEGKNYPDSYFSDQPDKREERLNQYMNLFSNKNKADEYLVRLVNSNFSLAYLDILNEMVNAFEVMLPFELMERQKAIEQLADSIEKKILEKRDVLNGLQEKMSSGFGSKDFEILFNLSFELFTKEFLAKLLILIKNHVQEVTTMEDFSKEETMLREFCINHDIPELKILFNTGSYEYYEQEGDRVFFSSDLLGGEAFERSEMLTLARRMANHVDESINGLFVNVNKKNPNTHIFTRWNKELKGAFEEYFKSGKKKYYYNNKDLRQKIFAVIVNDSFGVRTDLVFTVDGIICDKAFTGFSDNPSVTLYHEITDENNRINIGEEVYKNKELDMVSFYDLVQNLAEMSSTFKSTDSISDRYLEYNEVPLIDKN